MNTSNQQTNTVERDSAQEYAELSGHGVARAIVEANRQPDLANDKGWSDDEIREIEDGLIAEGLYVLPGTESVDTFFNQMDEMFAPLHQGKEGF